MNGLIENGEKAEVIRLITDDGYFISRIPHYFKVIIDYHKYYSKAFKCLVKLQSLINNRTLRRPLRRLYEISLNEGLDDLLRTLFQIFRYFRAA